MKRVSLLLHLRHPARAESRVMPPPGGASPRHLGGASTIGPFALQCRSNGLAPLGCSWHMPKGRCSTRPGHADPRRRRSRQIPLRSRAGRRGSRPHRFRAVVARQAIPQHLPGAPCAKDAVRHPDRQTQAAREAVVDGRAGWRASPPVRRAPDARPFPPRVQTAGSGDDPRFGEVRAEL